MLERGSVVVAAFDEHRDRRDRFPLLRPGVLYAYGIGTRNEARREAGTVAIGARDAFTLQPDAGYNVLSGHSMAAPIVSARVALFQAAMPGAGIDALHNALRKLKTASE